MGSDLKRAFTEDGQRRTHIGGQALIEGVMMRGKLNWAVAVREPDGHMHSEEHPLSKKGKRAKWLSWPLVRGCVALVDSLVLGYKALEIAANHAFDDEDEQAETVAGSGRLVHRRRLRRSRIRFRGSRSHWQWGPTRIGRQSGQKV